MYYINKNRYFWIFERIYNKIENILVLYGKEILKVINVCFIFLKDFEGRVR